ncbi:MAG: beta-ketoacyl-[acyl-carrier-protein] synthase II [Gammaproteobacteria bacterium]|nr:beta-ketoacyl-[acyl-carrier-protein] synthase II [Gammaproteobacteria bacterium]|tara:strand:- start:17263 stop:18504 length:1242 start_codon:yes stop_codon:yes gene_type:complete
MSKRRVVVTGMGCLTPIGNSVEEFWSSALKGMSGVTNITTFDVSDMSVKFSASVKNFDVETYLDNKEQRKMDLFMQYGMAAGIQAITDSKLDSKNINSDKVGISIGSGIGGLQYIENTHTTYTSSGARRISPFFVPASIINMISGNLSIKFGFKGPNLSIVTACTTGTHNIGEGFRQIQYSHADVMICGGAEMATSPLGLGGFAAARALSTRNEDPKTASRPWDINRDGFVLGDGAGVIVLEELNHALKRNAKIYAEISGYGMSADAYHMTLPPETGDGAARCMENALIDAGIKANQIEYINAHGTSTPAGDVAEVAAIKNIFKDHSKKLVVNSTKSMIGHLLGAAGGVESIATILSIYNQKAHPTINIFNQDPKCDLNFNSSKSSNVEISHALSNSFGFGGTNGSLIFSKYE